VHILFIGCHSVGYVPSKRHVTAQQQTHDKVYHLTNSSVQCLRIGSNVSPQRLFFYQKCRPRPGPVPI